MGDEQFLTSGKAVQTVLQALPRDQEYIFLSEGDLMLHMFCLLTACCDVCGSCGAQHSKYDWLCYFPLISLLELGVIQIFQMKLC